MTNEIFYDFDKIFETINVNNNFPYNKDDSNLLMYGYIGLENAKKRMAKNEYYPLVRYDENEVLPEEYIPISSIYLKHFDLSDEKFATISPKVVLQQLCANGNLYPIIRTSSANNKVEYHLGFLDGGSFSLETIIYCQIMNYLAKKAALEDKEIKKQF